MPSGRLADQGDATIIDFIVLGMRYDPANGRLHVVGAGRPAMFGRQPIVDAEPNEARSRKRFKERLDERLLVTSHETPTMHQDAGWKRAETLGHERIERQVCICDFREFD